MNICNIVLVFSCCSNFLFSPFVVCPCVSKFSLLEFEIVSSSATKEVVILTRGNIAILDTWLNTAIETPTAASSTAPELRLCTFILGRKKYYLYLIK